MTIRKLIKDVQVMKFEKGDILIVKLQEKRTIKEIELIKDALTQVIPKDLEVKIIFSNPDIEFEIIRRKS